MPPCDKGSENNMQATEPGSEEHVAPGRGSEHGEASEQHEAEPHDGKAGHGKGAPSDDPCTVKQQPHWWQRRVEPCAKQKECEKCSRHQRRGEAESYLARWPGK